MLILYIIINWGIIKEMQIYLIQRSLSILKTCIQVALYGLNRLYFGIYIYTSTCIHIITISVERSQGFERKQRGTYGRVDGGKGRVKCFN